MSRDNLRVVTRVLDGSNTKEVELDVDMGIEIHLPGGDVIVIDARKDAFFGNDSMVGVRAKDGRLQLRPSSANEVFVGIQGTVTEIRRANEMQALTKARLWEHHKDCKPLSREGCKCGLWHAQEAAKIYEAQKKHDDQD